MSRGLALEGYAPFVAATAKQFGFAYCFGQTFLAIPAGCAVAATTERSPPATSRRTPAAGRRIDSHTQEKAAPYHRVPYHRIKISSPT